MTAKDVIENRVEWSLEVGDSTEWTWTIPRNSVHCVVTSPPYFGLRDYQMDGQIGLEETPGEYVTNLVSLFRGIKRALHPTGVVWLNLGDTYGRGERVSNPNDKMRGETGNTGQVAAVNSGAYGTGIVMPDKQLMGIPWRVAFALQQDGWWLRQWLPWIKRNPMPDSAEDRPGTACETVFMLTKSKDYYFDMEAVKRTGRSEWNGTQFLPDSDKDRSNKGIPTAATGASRSNGSTDSQSERNFRSSDLWFDSVGLLMADDGELLGLDVPVRGSKVVHFAMMPHRLARPLVQAGSSERGVCPSCFNPWVRIVEKERIATRPGTDTKVTGDGLTDGNRDPERHVTKTKTVGWNPSCSCGGNPIPAVVMDPFAGSGTTLIVARDLKRRAVGCELNPEYAATASKRIGNVISNLF